MSADVLPYGCTIRAAQDSIQDTATSAVFSRISNPAIMKLRLPNLPMNSQLAFRAIGEPTLDEVHATFYRQFGAGSKENMEMIWHQHERVQVEATLRPVFPLGRN